VVTTKLIEDLGLKKPWEQLHEASGEEPRLVGALQAHSATLAKAIRDGTVTIRQIDKFIRQHPQLTPPLEVFLLDKKAWLLSHEGKLEEALRLYDEALRVDEEPVTWALKGAALLQLDRIDEAFHAFNQAYSLRAKFGPQKQGYLKDLLQGWSTAAALRGVFGILQHDSRELQKGVEEYLGVLDKARAENLGDAATVYLKAEDPASDELKEVIEEWELAVRLLSIKDPFDRFRALSKEVSKVWPEGVSAVDAVREQRDREWNT
jgi:tetratricopeptide (TPR) repeat protein